MKRRFIYISACTLFAFFVAQGCSFAQNVGNQVTTTDRAQFTYTNNMNEIKSESGNQTQIVPQTTDSNKQVNNFQNNNNNNVNSEKFIDGNSSNIYTQSAIFNNMQNSVYSMVEVPDNYPIPIVFIKDVDSETSSNGDKIPIRPASDIYINNKLIFSKDASGYAIIKSVRPARNLGKYGYIIIKEGFLPDTTGTLRAVSFGTKIHGERCQWAGIIGHAMIWNPVGWIVGLKEGTPAAIKSGDTATFKNKVMFSL